MSRSRAQKVPDAWDDDDWETQADRAAKEPPREEAPTPSIKDTARIEMHKEQNRKLWESADSPEPFHFLETSNPVPAATTNFKPQVKLLSRKPTPVRDPTANMAKLSLENEEDEAEANRRHQIEAEARMREGERLLPERQKAYEEARRRIFGEEKEDEGRQSGRGSGRGRGSRGVRGRGRGGRGTDGRGSDTSRSAGSSRSGTPSGARRESPRSSPKPSILQKSEAQQPKRRDDGQTPAIREPRGPDGSGRGGFGFARRGAK